MTTVTLHHADGRRPDRIDIPDASAALLPPVPHRHAAVVPSRHPLLLRAADVLCALLRPLLALLVLLGPVARAPRSAWRWLNAEPGRVWTVSAAAVLMVTAWSRGGAAS